MRWELGVNFRPGAPSIRRGCRGNWVPVLCCYASSLQPSVFSSVKWSQAHNGLSLLPRG